MVTKCQLIIHLSIRQRFLRFLVFFRLYYVGLLCTYIRHSFGTNGYNVTDVPEFPEQRRVHLLGTNKARATWAGHPIQGQLWFPVELTGSKRDGQNT